MLQTALDQCKNPCSVKRPLYGGTQWAEDIFCQTRDCCTTMSLTDHCLLFRMQEPTVTSNSIFHHSLLRQSCTFASAPIGETTGRETINAFVLAVVRWPLGTQHQQQQLLLTNASFCPDTRYCIAL